MLFYQASHQNIHPLPSQFLRQVDTVIDSNLEDDKFSIEQLCKTIGYCRMQLHRKLKSATGYSASQYIRLRRIESAKNLLDSTDKTISEIAYQVGFNTPSYFTRCFILELGMTPSAYRNRFTCRQYSTTFKGDFSFKLS